MASCLMAICPAGWSNKGQRDFCLIDKGLRMHNDKMHASNGFGRAAMAMLTVRNLTEEVHRALRARAAQHGKSMEAEVRDILEEAIKPKGRVKLGSLLADMGRQARLSDEEFAIFEQVRDKTPSRLVSFE
jgi:plasmid stability protein